MTNFLITTAVLVQMVGVWMISVAVVCLLGMALTRIAKRYGPVAVLVLVGFLGVCLMIASGAKAAELDPVVVTAKPWPSAREWSNAEIGAGLYAMSMLALDYGTTRDIVQSRDKGYYEQNRLLGRHPSMATVNQWVAVSALVVLTTAHYFPEYRLLGLTVYGSVEAAYVAHNLSIGLRVRY